jgi:hypothetical protein
MLMALFSISLLSAMICHHFPMLLVFFFLLAFHFSGSLCLANILLCYFQNSPFRLGSETCFGLSGCVPVFLLVLPGLQGFCIRLIKLWQCQCLFSLL